MPEEPFSKQAKDTSYGRKARAGDARPFMPAIIVDRWPAHRSFAPIVSGLAQAIREGSLRLAEDCHRPRHSPNISASPATPRSGLEQLIAEGHVEGRIGAGTDVASSAAKQLLQIEPRGPIAQPTVNSARRYRAAPPSSCRFDPKEPWDEAGAIRAFRVGRPRSISFLMPCGNVCWCEAGARGAPNYLTTGGSQRTSAGDRGISWHCARRALNGGQRDRGRRRTARHRSGHSCAGGGRSAGMD